MYAYKRNETNRPSCIALRPFAYAISVYTRTRSESKIAVLRKEWMACAALARVEYLLCLGRKKKRGEVNVGDDARVKGVAAIVPLAHEHDR
jgi:hypothetical protein